MARKPEIQYIRYYTDGTAARKPEPQQLPRKQKKPLPQKKRRPRYVLKVQPLAVLGIVLSVVLLCMMAGGISDYLDARQELQQMQEYVYNRRLAVSELRETYEEGIDLEEIRRAALALGMVPEEQVPHMTISVPKPQAEEDGGFMMEMTAFLTGLIA